MIDSCLVYKDPFYKKLLQLSVKKMNPLKKKYFAYKITNITDIEETQKFAKNK